MLTQIMHRARFRHLAVKLLLPLPQRLRLLLLLRLQPLLSLLILLIKLLTFQVRHLLL